MSRLTLTAVLAEPARPERALDAFLELVSAFGHRDLTVAWPQNPDLQAAVALRQDIAARCQRASIESVAHLDAGQVVPQLLSRSDGIEALLAVGSEGRLLCTMAQQVLAGQRGVPVVKLDGKSPVMRFQGGCETPRTIEYLGSLVLALVAGGHGNTANRIWNSVLALREQGLYADGEATVVPYARCLDGVDYVNAVRQALGQEPKRQPAVVFGSNARRAATRPQLTSVA